MQSMGSGYYVWKIVYWKQDRLFLFVRNVIYSIEHDTI